MTGYGRSGQQWWLFHGTSGIIGCLLLGCMCLVRVTGGVIELVGWIHWHSSTSFREFLAGLQILGRWRMKQVLGVGNFLPFFNGGGTGSIYDVVELCVY